MSRSLSTHPCFVFSFPISLCCFKAVILIWFRLKLSHLNPRLSVIFFGAKEMSFFKIMNIIEINKSKTPYSKRWHMDLFLLGLKFILLTSDLPRPAIIILALSLAVTFLSVLALRQLDDIEPYIQTIRHTTHRQYQAIVVSVGGGGADKIRLYLSY